MARSLRGSPPVKEDRRPSISLINPCGPSTAMHRIIDWNELWKAVYAASPLRKKKDLDPGSAWDKKAAAYERAVNDEAAIAAQEVGMMALLPGDRVLDMGAGTGRLAVPMAQVAAHVTALDPSERMLEKLAAGMAAKGLTNYSCIRMRWEDAAIGENVEEHDVVVAAYSLGFYDLGAALEKIDAAASRSVCLFWHAGEWRTPAEIALRQAVFGGEGEDVGYPDYSYIINILHDREIYADVTVYEAVLTNRYASPEEAAEEWATLHEAPKESLGTIAEHFAAMLEPDGAGGYLHRKRRRQAMIRWQKK
jgi:SAM-dependent methyltransferase